MCILSIEENKTGLTSKRLYEASDFPTKFKHWQKLHFIFEDLNAFMSKTRADSGCNITGSLALGMGVGSRGQIKSSWVDLKKIGVELYVKDLQHLHTKKQLTLVEVMNEVDVDYMGQMAMGLLERLKHRLVEERYREFPQDIHYRPFPETLANVKWATGTNRSWRPRSRAGCMGEGMEE